MEGEDGEVVGGLQEQARTASGLSHAHSLCNYREALRSMERADGRERERASMERKVEACQRRVLFAIYRRSVSWAPLGFRFSITALQPPATPSGPPADPQQLGGPVTQRPTDGFENRIADGTTSTRLCRWSREGKSNGANGARPLVLRATWKASVRDAQLLRCQWWSSMDGI